MLIAAAAASSSSSLGLGGSGPFQFPGCHVEPGSCLASYGSSGTWIKPPFELQRIHGSSGLSFKSENPFFGASQLPCLSMGNDFCIQRVSVAADYSDSVPDSSSCVNRNGYHPLEELRDRRRSRDIMPTSAQIARNAVEANNKALLMFPSIVHCEPHEQISWQEFEYIIDDFGDIFIEICDDQNILQDREASNPVTALIGMDISYYETKRMDLPVDSTLETDSGDDFYFADDFFEVEDSDLTANRVDWGMPDNFTWIHPVYFAKCLTQAVDIEHTRLMEYPSSGVSVSGLLRPTFSDEEFYLRRLFDTEDTDDCISELKDGDSVSFRQRDEESRARWPRSTIYRLEITKIELFSIYGVQSVVGVQDFQYAEPDILVHSIPSILERFGEKGTSCSGALKALCKKKGLHVERAHLVGVDSLGVDVRVSSGTELRTHRFPFKVRATSECAATKQIQQLLFPRSRRKKLRTSDRTRDMDSI